MRAAIAASSSSTSSGGIDVSHSMSVGHRTEPATRPLVQMPDPLHDAGAMVVDQQFSGGGMAGQVNLADGFLGDFEQRLFGIETVVDRIDEHIVDVEQDAAAAALREFGKESELG